MSKKFKRRILPTLGLFAMACVTAIALYFQKLHPADRFEDAVEKTGNDSAAFAGEHFHLSTCLDDQTLFGRISTNNGAVRADFFTPFAPIEFAAPERFLADR